MLHPSRLIRLALSALAVLAAAASVSASTGQAAARSRDGLLPTTSLPITPPADTTTDTTPAPPADGSDPSSDPADPGDGTDDPGDTGDDSSGDSSSTDDGSTDDPSCTDDDSCSATSDPTDTSGCGDTSATDPADTTTDPTDTTTDPTDTTTDPTDGTGDTSSADDGTDESSRFVHEASDSTTCSQPARGVSTRTTTRTAIRKALRRGYVDLGWVALPAAGTLRVVLVDPSATVTRARRHAHRAAGTKPRPTLASGHASATAKARVHLIAHLTTSGRHTLAAARQSLVLQLRTTIELRSGRVISYRSALVLSA